MSDFMNVAMLVIALAPFVLIVVRMFTFKSVPKNEKAKLKLMK